MELLIEEKKHKFHLESKKKAYDVNQLYIYNSIAGQSFFSQYALVRLYLNA